MNIDEIVALVPEDKREAVKTEFAAFVKVGSREDAEKLAREHPHIKSAFDAEISRASAANEARIMKEKLPGMVEAEIKKRNPEKDPLRIELDTLKAEREAEKAELKRERLKAMAVKLAADEGIPVDDIDRFIDEDEDRTTASVKAYAKRTKAWRDSQIEAELKKRFGNQSSPRTGTVTDDPNLSAQYNALMLAGRTDEAAAISVRLMRERNKGN
jgi:hypothetical protein